MVSIKYSKALTAFMMIASCTMLVSCYKKFDTKSYAPALVIGGFTSSKEIAPANLVAYWSFDGSYIDSISGTLAENNGTTLVTGYKGQAMQGALNSYVLATPPASITGMTSFTVGYWVNSPLHPAGIAGIVALANTNQFWGNIEMFLENGGTLEAMKFRAKVITNGTTEIGIDKDGVVNFYTKWNHLALSYDETTSTFKFYVNGAVSTSKVVAATGPLSFVNNGKIVFGTASFQTTPSQTTHGPEPWASFMTGQLDEVRFYNKALTDGEISALVKLEGRGK
ncbi:MAG: LamG domain-containing protein [Chitinophagaceae bacterium]|nr:LamG domain-containing protein [Chitinophagaceae bacterium]